MPLLTLSTGTTYNLRKLMDGTTAGSSHTEAANYKSGMVSRLILKVPNGVAGTVYVARNNAAISSTDYDLSLKADNSFLDVLHERGNMVDMNEFSIVVSANMTLEVYAVPY